MRFSSGSFSTRLARHSSISNSVATKRNFSLTPKVSNDHGHPSNQSDAPKLSPLFTPLKGKRLLEEPILNKGTAFTDQERTLFHLKHLLPFEYHTLPIQLKRAQRQLFSDQRTKDPVLQYSFLRSMRDQNQVLFYALLQSKLKETLSIIYTPTVGEAIKQYSHLFRRADGLFLNYANFKKAQEEGEGGEVYLREALTDFGAKNKHDIDLLVVTDGEGILGLGDMGAGGIDITIGKQTLYTLGGGIDPNRCLNIILDCGTNNEQLLNDELYLGWREKRVEGPAYDEFVDAFVKTAAKSFPDALIHFEDFGNANAFRLLTKFQDQYSVFNDDIQGTGATALAALMSAVKVLGSNLKDQRIVLQGAGTAGMGIVNRIRDAMIQTEGISKEEANSRFYLIDRNGLVNETQKDLKESHKEFARTEKEIEKWDTKSGKFDLLDTVKAIKPTVLIGTSTVANSFTEEVVKEMSKNCERPIILPLSNPTSLCEVIPQDAFNWSKGKALIATGSPFAPVKYGDSGKEMVVAELNNALMFPALGLGTILSKSARLTDKMIVAGVEALASLSPALQSEEKGLLPDLEEVRSISVKVASAVMKQAKKENQAKEEFPVEDEELEKFIEERMWKPVYRPLKPVETVTG